MDALLEFVCGLLWAAQPGDAPAAYWTSLGEDRFASASHALAYANKGRWDAAWYFNSPSWADKELRQ